MAIQKIKLTVPMSTLSGFTPTLGTPSSLVSNDYVGEIYIAYDDTPTTTPVDAVFYLGGDNVGYADTTADSVVNLGFIFIQILEPSSESQQGDSNTVKIYNESPVREDAMMYFYKQVMAVHVNALIYHFHSWYNKSPLNAPLSKNWNMITQSRGSTTALLLRKILTTNNLPYSGYFKNYLINAPLIMRDTSVSTLRLNRYDKSLEFLSGILNVKSDDKVVIVQNDGDPAIRETVRLLCKMCVFGRNWSKFYFYDDKTRGHTRDASLTNLWLENIRDGSNFEYIDSDEVRQVLRPMSYKA